MCLFTCQKCKTTINQRETTNHECEPRADDAPTDAEVEAADRGRVEHNIRRKLTDAEWAATRSSIEHESMRAALTAAREAQA